jgi:TetR/AcrR family transcriptional regulator
VQYLSTAEMPIKERIYQFIDTYVDMLHNNPYLPLFVLHELQRDPENIFFKMFQNTRVNPQMVFGNIQNEIEKGNIHQVDPKHLMVNIIGMCIIPFVGKPIMKHALFSGNETKYNEFLNERKTQIKSFVSLALNLQ